MQTPEGKKTYREKLETLLATPDLAATIIDYIKNGGSMITLAEIWDVRYNDLHSFMNRQPDGPTVMNEALKVRDEWAQQRVLHELSHIAYIDIRKAFDENGALKAMKDMPAEVARAISSIDVDELFAGTGAEREMVGYTKKIKFWNKTESLEKIGQELGMFSRKIKVSSDFKLEDLLSASRAEPKPAEQDPPKPASDSK